MAKSLQLPKLYGRLTVAGTVAGFNGIPILRSRLLRQTLPPKFRAKIAFCFYDTMAL